MQKYSKFLLGSVLILTLVLASFSSVKADSEDVPTITSVSGDQVFKSSSVSLESLPGTEKLGEMIVPAGFPSGEVQFGGLGLAVSGLDYGQASLCYNIKTSAVGEGWGGKVGLWTGTKWELLPTTVTPPTEGTLSSACASISSSGTYAFIKYVADASLLPKLKCTFTATPFYYHYGEGAVLSARLSGSGIPAVNTVVQYKVLSYEPEGALGGVMEGTILHGIYGPIFSDFITVYVDEETIESADLYVEYPNCSFTLHYSDTTGWD